MDWQSLTKNTKLLYWIGGIALVAIGTGSGYWYATSRTTPQTTSEATPSALTQPTASPTQSATATTNNTGLTSLDNTWNKYSNAKLGFSLKIPKNMRFESDCKLTTENGKQTYKETEGSVPVKVFEESAIVHIGPEYIYNLSGETKDDSSAYYYSKCDKVIVTAEIMKNRFKETLNTFPGWDIIIKTINNDQELDAFLKQEYGKGCSLDKKVDSAQSGVFDIEIKGDGKDLGETECPINYKTVVKYYPAKKKLAKWDIGQAYNFSSPTSDENYDDEMTKSFLFD